MRTDQERGESEGFGSIEEETGGDGLTEGEEGRKEGAEMAILTCFYNPSFFFFKKKKY